MLTDSIVRTATPKEKKYKITDRDGLALLIYPQGYKYFKLYYVFNGKKKEFTIGKYPLISLAQARRVATQLRVDLINGIDPQQAKLDEKQAKSKARTLQEVAIEWFSKHKAKLTDRYATEKWRALEVNIFPYFTNRDINSITPPELLEVIRIIEGRGAIERASRIKNYVKEIYAYAIASGISERNIANDLQGALQARPPQQHYSTITEPLKIGELLRAIDSYEGDRITAIALKIAPYVILRPNELASAKWEDIDLDNALWKIPAEQMKKRRVHIVPLPRQAVELLKHAELFKMLNSPYVFPSLRSSARHMNPSTLNASLRRLGYPQGTMTAHGFRAMGATLLYENGYTEDLVELQLAHIEQNKVKGAYNHSKLIDKRRAMLQWLADYLDKLKNG